MRNFLLFIISILSFSFIHVEPIDFSNIEKTKITVTVNGAVKNPGKYELKNYSCLQDLLDLAIVSEDGDTSVLNLQTILHDHDTIYVPNKEDTQIQRISINSATKEQLLLLPGIGESIAERIIAYREEYGFFQSLDELKNVKGIGEVKFKKLEMYVSL